MQPHAARPSRQCRQKHRCKQTQAIRSPVPALQGAPTPCPSPQPLAPGPASTPAASASMSPSPSPAGWSPSSASSASSACTERAFDRRLRACWSPRPLAHPPANTPLHTRPPAHPCTASSLLDMAQATFEAGRKPCPPPPPSHLRRALLVLPLLLARILLPLGCGFAGGGAGARALADDVRLQQPLQAGHPGGAGEGGRAPSVRGRQALCRGGVSAWRQQQAACPAQSSRGKAGRAPHPTARGPPGSCCCAARLPALKPAGQLPGSCHPPAGQRP